MAAVSLSLSHASRQVNAGRLSNAQKDPGRRLRSVEADDNGGATDNNLRGHRQRQGLLDDLALTIPRRTPETRRIKDNYFAGSRGPGCHSRAE
jgi:hypothetical protein